MVRVTREHLSNFAVLAVLALACAYFLDFGSMSFEEMGFFHYLLAAYLGLAVLPAVMPTVVVRLAASLLLGVFGFRMGSNAAVGWALFIVFAAAYLFFLSVVFAELRRIVASKSKKAPQAVLLVALFLLAELLLAVSVLQAGVCC